MMTKAKMAEMVRVVPDGLEPPISREKAGAPNQPRARLAPVTPNWVADRYASKWLTMWLATWAPRLPSAASSAIRVSRTFTMENSAMTKKALTTIRRTTPRISITARPAVTVVASGVMAAPPEGSAFRGGRYLGDLQS